MLPNSELALPSSCMCIGVNCSHAVSALFRLYERGFLMQQLSG